MIEIESSEIENNDVINSSSQEEMRADAIRRNSLEVINTRRSLEALLTNIKENNASLEHKLNTDSSSREQHEKELENHGELKNSDIKSYMLMSLQVSNLEKQLDELRYHVEQEKQKTRKALELKRSADKKNEIYEKRSVQHQQEVYSLRNKLKQYQHRLEALEEKNSQISALNAELDLERQTTSANVSKLKCQVDQLTEQLSHEQEIRVAEEKKNCEQQNELTDIKAREKVQSYEQERLQHKCSELQMELQRQKEYYEQNFHPVEEIEEFKKALETKVRLDLNKKLEDVNMHLEEQSLVREAYDKMRNGIERKTKTGFKEAVSKLKNDLSEVKASLQEGMVKRGASVIEAQHYKELFESERNNSGMLADELAKSTDMLNFERTRANHLFEETLNKSKVTKKLFEESLEKEKKNLLSTRLHDNLGLNSSFYQSKFYSTPLKSRTPLRRHGF